jgi:uncharacterized protein YkwD
LASFLPPILVAAVAAALFPCRLTADDFDALREEFLESVNVERAREGAGPLQLSVPLVRLAQQFAEDAARRGDPEFPTIGQAEILSRAEKAGYSPKAMAEVFTRAGPHGRRRPRSGRRRRGGNLPRHLQMRSPRFG